MSAVCPCSAAERSAIPRSTVNTAFDAKAEFLVEDRCQIDEVVNELKGRMVWRGLTDEIANADFDALQRVISEQISADILLLSGE